MKIRLLLLIPALCATGAIAAAADEPSMAPEELAAAAGALTQLDDLLAEATPFAQPFETPGGCENTDAGSAEICRLAVTAILRAQDAIACQQLMDVAASDSDGAAVD